MSIFFRYYFLVSTSYLYQLQCNIHFTDIDVYDISEYTVGTRYLKNLQISSAEMTQYICNIRMAGMNCLTKKYRVPFFNTVLTNKMVLKYMDRPQRFESITLVQYGR